MCRYCDKKIRTCGNTSNMRGHLTYSHASVLSPKKDEKNASKKRCNPQSSSTSSENKKSKVESDFGTSTLKGTNADQSSPSSDKDLDLGSSPSKGLENVRSVFEKMTSFKEGGSKHTQLTDKIIFMICKDSQAVNIVEREGFKNLIKYLAPHYSMPCRKTFGKKLDEKYEKLSTKYKKFLTTVKDLTLTTDLWTDTQNTRSFLGITGHYRVGSAMESIVLGVYEFPLSHTAANLEAKLKDVCGEWEITKDRISAIVTDNASNIVRAVKDFVGESKHLGCSAHKINLIVQNSILKVSSVPPLIQKVKVIVTWFKQSNKASEALREASHLKLKQDVSTRWNSTYYMLMRFIEIRGSVAQVICEHSGAPPMITPTEVGELKEICKVLQLFEEVTREFSGETYVTLSKVIPLINGLVQQLQDMNTENFVAEELKTQMLSETKQQFPSLEKNKLYAIATLLDPRFKKVDFLDSIACSHAVNNIKEKLQKQPPEVCTSTSTSSDLEENVIEGPKSFLWARHMELQKLDQRKKDQSSSSAFEMPTEISLYLRTPIASLEADPVRLWVDMEASYPGLAKIAFKYLTIVATSVPSERLFSKAGENMTARRNRLSAKRLHKLLFLSSVSKTLCLEKQEPTKSSSVINKEKSIGEEGSSTVLACAVCLQRCTHPTRLPCSHIFCFLCLKRVVNQTTRCPMCRQEIPADFLESSQLVNFAKPQKEATADNEEEYQ